jgi:hypothetical protein
VTQCSIVQLMTQIASERRKMPSRISAALRQMACPAGSDRGANPCRRRGVEHRAVCQVRNRIRDSRPHGGIVCLLVHDKPGGPPQYWRDPCSSVFFRGIEWAHHDTGHPQGARQCSS